MDNEFDDLVISDYLLNYNLDVENEIPLYILKQAEKLFNEIFDLTDNIEIVIDKLIMLLIKIQDRGYNFMETNQFISQCITISNLATSNISNWLINNQTKSQYIFFLGFLYYNGIIVEKNTNEAFKLFSKASENNYPMAQVYLSKCYQTGIGIEFDHDLAITCLYNSIEYNSICGQLYLGNLYENSMDIYGNCTDIRKLYGIIYRIVTNSVFLIKNVYTEFVWKL